MVSVRWTRDSGERSEGKVSLVVGSVGRFTIEAATNSMVKLDAGADSTIAGDGARGAPGRVRGARGDARQHAAEGRRGDADLPGRFPGGDPGGRLRGGGRQTTVPGPPLRRRAQPA